MTPREQVIAYGALCAGFILGIMTTVALSIATHVPHASEQEAFAPAPPAERKVLVTIEHKFYPPPPDCALLAMARIASTEGATVGRGRWHVARTAGELADTCEESIALVALSRQESTWTPSEVSHAGACGVTQVRSCDAEGTFPGGMSCCDEYRQGGHHCRPTCEWLLRPENGLAWTLAWLRDRGGWDPWRYVGARNPEVGAGYVERAEGWLRMARGGEQ